MRRTLLYSALTIIVIACGPQPTISETDEKYEPTDEELFAACAELKGVGQYIIGKSTFQSVQKDKEFRQNCSGPFDRDNNLYNGHWGNDFWRRKGGDISETFDERKFIEKDVKGKVKQLYGGLSFKVGELEFDKFDMAFLNDTLVAIWFFPDSDALSDITDHYIEKYGNGRGKLYDYHYSLKHSDGQFTFKSTHDELHVWENENVALEYKNYDNFYKEPDSRGSSYFDRHMIIYSKSRYPVFEQILKDSAAKWESLQKSNKESTLNSL